MDTKNEEQIELLHPTQIPYDIQGRIDELTVLLKDVEKRLKDAPAGTLRIATNKGTTQYYHVLKSSKRNGIYIHKSQMEFIKKLAQKAYDRKLQNELHKQISLLNKMKKLTMQDRLAGIYENNTTQRQELLTPVTLSDKDFIKKWSERPYQHFVFFAQNALYMTENKEMVRSKSEKMIADLLLKNNIPYKYEAPLQLEYDENQTQKNHTIYPDFCCLRLKDRKEIIWEHFGMMDNPEYVKSFEKKADLYTANKIKLQQEIIWTFESSENPLIPQKIQMMIDQYFVL